MCDGSLASGLSRSESSLTTITIRVSHVSFRDLFVEYTDTPCYCLKVIFSKLLLKHPGRRIRESTTRSSFPGSINKQRIRSLLLYRSPLHPPIQPMTCFSPPSFRSRQRGILKSRGIHAGPHLQRGRLSSQTWLPRRGVSALRHRLLSVCSIKAVLLRPLPRTRHRPAL
jgi:hypothetical protein